MVVALQHSGPLFLFPDRGFNPTLVRWSQRFSFVKSYTKMTEDQALKQLTFLISVWFHSMG